MGYHRGALNLGRDRLSEEREPAPGPTTVKGLPMLLQETVLQHEAEKRRIKKSILADTEETTVFSKTLYLPYLDFTYQYPASKGLFSKQTLTAQGRSVAMALREVDLGFYPELTALVPRLIDLESGSDLIVRGIDSTVLVNERLEELKRTLSEYDARSQELSMQYDSLQKMDPARQALKENIDHLKRTRESRWKIFADGLKLPSRVELGKLELLEGNLFYIPYFIVRFARTGESRFFVWDRQGKENDSIAEELMKNSRFRDLIQSHATSRDIASDSDLGSSENPGSMLSEFLSLEEKEPEDGSSSKVG